MADGAVGGVSAGATAFATDSVTVTGIGLASELVGSGALTFAVDAETSTVPTSEVVASDAAGATTGAIVVAVAESFVSSGACHAGACHADSTGMDVGSIGAPSAELLDPLELSLLSTS